MFDRNREPRRVRQIREGIATADAQLNDEELLQARHDLECFQAVSSETGRLTLTALRPGDSFTIWLTYGARYIYGGHMPDRMMRLKKIGPETADFVGEADTLFERGNSMGIALGDPFYQYGVPPNFLVKLHGALNFDGSSVEENSVVDGGCVDYSVGDMRVSTGQVELAQMGVVQAMIERPGIDERFYMFSGRPYQPEE